MDPNRVTAADIPPSLDSRVRAGVDQLTRAGIPTPDVDAELLAAHACGLGRGALHAAMIRGDAMTAAQGAAYASLLEQRAARVPLQHLTGTAPFRHLELLVGPGVFVPRPETEIVAQFAIDALRAAAAPAPIAVDLGTGSGALALAMATEVPHARVHAAENAVDAFLWARRNVRHVGADNVRLVFADLADAFGDLDGTVSVVVSNPPYVPDEAIPRDPEVRRHEPPSALYGGADGLDVVRTLEVTARRLLHPGGTLVIEHGEWQGAAIRDLLTAAGWRGAATHPDLTLRDRATTAVR